MSNNGPDMTGAPDAVGLKGTVARGLLWGGLSTTTMQLLNLVIGIFLARILTPADYGMVGVLAVFTAIANALTEGGFISAMANRKEVSELDFCSVFWFSTLSAVIFYIILFCSAPFIANFYGLPELTDLSRFVFLSFVIAGLSIAPRAFLFRNLRVKDSARSSVMSLVASGIIGVAMAMNGFAYWGLATQTVAYIFFVTLFSYYFSRWRPQLRFSWKPVRSMLGYSSKLIITNVFNILNNNIFAVLLGRFYTASAVGDFNQANKWNTMGFSLVSGMIQGVAQPAFARVAHDRMRITAVLRKMLRFTAFVCFPLMLGLSFVATDLIVLAITEKWLFSAAILQILCIGGAFYPISFLFSNLVLGQGRSQIYMWITIALAVCQMVAVFFSYPYGLITMVWVFIAVNILWVAVWWLVIRRSVELTFFNLMADTLPFLFFAVISFVPAYFAASVLTSLWLILSVKIIVSAVVYIVLLWLAHAKTLRESIYYIRDAFTRKKSPIE